MIVGKKNSQSVRNRYTIRSQKSIQYALDVIKKSELSSYVRHVYLYGSCARNEQTYQSDVDLLIELDPAFELQDNKRNAILNLKKSLCCVNTDLPDIEVKIMIGNEWENHNSLFLKNVRKDGVDLW